VALQANPPSLEIVKGKTKFGRRRIPLTQPTERILTANFISPVDSRSGTPKIVTLGL
jgi:hypothetical protein